MFDHTDIIFSYTRAQAIADGVLIDLTEEAAKHGFRIPFACTDSIWQEIEWGEHEKPGAGQCTEGRLYDVLHMAILSASQAKEASQVEVQVWMVPWAGDSMVGKLYTYKLHVGPGDQGEPVITLMQLHED